MTCSWSDSEDAVKAICDRLLDVANDDDTDISNAADLLIHIINFVKLTSPILISLTSQPLIGEICDVCFTKLTSNGSSESIAAAKARQEAACRVLEGIVLQLGGYGMAVNDEQMEIVASGGKCADSSELAKILTARNIDFTNILGDDEGNGVIMNQRKQLVSGHSYVTFRLRRVCSGKRAFLTHLFLSRL